MSQWVVNSTDDVWDDSLAKLGGHPLQSTLWGSARREIDGIVDHRFLLVEKDQVKFMARVEERGIAGLGRVAWIPKGPAATESGPPVLGEGFTEILRARGFDLVVADRWARSDGEATTTVGRPRTIFIDLTLGSEALWKRLDSKARSSVSRARRECVECEQTRDPADLAWFTDLCRRTEAEKGFRGPGSPALMDRIVHGGNAAVGGKLFVARVGSTRASGAIVIRCGMSLHYFWGASDRSHARLQAGEALQWAIIEWGHSQGLSLYDMEGVDPEGNPGVFQFKKKFGGNVVELEGQTSVTLSWKGQLIDRVRRVKGP